MADVNSPSGTAQSGREREDATPAALAWLGERLLAAAEADPELRAALRAWAAYVLERTGGADSDPAGAVPSAGPRADHPLATAFDVDPSEITSPPSAFEQRFFASPATDDADRAAPSDTAGAGASAPEGEGEQAEDRGRGRAPVLDEHLPLIEQRCRLKAEAARWAADRWRYLTGNLAWTDALDQERQALVTRAKALPDCFLSPCFPETSQPADPSTWTQIADCFDTLATAVELARGLFANGDQEGDLHQPTIELLAEAQSMLRTAMLWVGGRDDADQCKVHRWLERVTFERGLFVHRYMKADDLADPGRLAALRERIDELHGRWSERHRQRRHRRERFRRIEYHLKQLAGNPLDPAHDRSVIVQAIEELVESGMPASDVELRQLLLPRLDELPEREHLPRPAQQVLVEIDRYLATRPGDDPDLAPAEPAPAVREVRRLLSGRTVLMIGGKRRAGSQRNLEEAFGLRELRWEDSSPHQPLSDFEPAIVRPEVALVLLAIRWTSHSYGQLKTVCDRTGKPLVRLPAGYGVNRVAAEIMAQCSEELRAGTSD